MQARTLPSHALARFAAECPGTEIPAAVRHEARRALVNYFAVALAGSRDPAIVRTRAVLGLFAGPAEARQVGWRDPVDVPTAALLNAAAANVFDFDDTHIPTILHPTAIVAAALFAWADREKVTGAALIEALAVGIEVECVIANALSPYHYSRGWHITSTCGVFGAAAAVGRLIGLDAQRMLWAFGTASALASGLVQTLGTMSKSVGVGSAARHGLLAALLAAGDVGGPDAPLEGPRGFMAVFGESDRSAEVAASLGAPWQLMRNTYKPYPCGVVLNPVIDACLALAREGGNFDGVDTITVAGHPLLRQRTDRPGVATGREAQVSAQHAVAVTLLRGRAGLTEFSDAAVAAPEVRALAARVVVRDDAAMAPGAARVEIAFADGSRRSETVTEATGSLEKPLTDAALEQKLRTLAEGIIAPDRVTRLAGALWAMDGLDDASLPMALASGAAVRTAGMADQMSQTV